ncbi:RepA [Faeces associated gemycircularvirus 4]|uniref:RepA n=1 Tax=Faeces associated gemycircularvirus 4 TaxID=1391033 RepID=A0A160HX46_9VIRU|nr:RepA [Faeces associated gemycircularvirus 4]
MPPKQFQFQARYVLLTYAQCGDLDAWAVNDHLAFLGGECIIGREHHADGGTHLHAFCDFSRKFRSRRPDVFDVGGFHPNIEASRGRPEGGYDYAIKDGDVVAGGLSRPGGRGVYEDVSSWSIIVSQESEGDFWECVARLDPRSLCTNYNSLRAYANWKYRPTPVQYVHPAGVEFELGMVPELAVWREIALGANRQRGKCPLRSGAISHLCLGLIWQEHCLSHVSRARTRQAGHEQISTACKVNVMLNHLLT